MKLSVTMAQAADEIAPIVFRGDYIENIKKASAMGYDSVEIHVNDPKTLDVEQILNACRKYNVDVSTIGTGMGYVIDRLSFTSPDEDIREKAVERILDHIDVAKKMGAKVIIGSIRGTIPDRSEYKKYQEYAIECTKKCLEKAEAKKVTLLIEAINRYETNFINTAEEGLEFVSKLNSEYIKIHLDTFHMNIEEDDMTKSIIMAGKHLGHMHFADSNRWYPGKGHINFKNVLKALKRIEYNGSIAFECLSLPRQDQAAISALKYIRDLMSKI
jgi:sugar phosphate isomerase/epimerase